MKESILKTKSSEFALKVVEQHKLLINDKKESVISKQLLRSGTSIGASIRETLNAESEMDVVHKLAIAQKECDETLYWIELRHQSGYLPASDYSKLSDLATELLRMLRSAILTIRKILKK